MVGGVANDRVLAENDHDAVFNGRVTRAWY